MEPNATADSTRDRETAAHDRFGQWVHDQPFGAAAVAGAVGIALGGFVFSRLGRLAFLVAAGFVTNELWRREGGLHLSDLIAPAPHRRGERLPRT